MEKKDFHTSVHKASAISLAIAALAKSFPLFLRPGDHSHVDRGGKETGRKDFQTFMAFSTSFPQPPVDIKSQ